MAPASWKDSRFMAELSSHLLQAFQSKSITVTFNVSDLLEKVDEHGESQIVVLGTLQGMSSGTLLAALLEKSRFSVVICPATPMDSSSAETLT
jgi:hypothetical protein